MECQLLATNCKYELEYGRSSLGLEIFFSFPGQEEANRYPL